MIHIIEIKIKGLYVKKTMYIKTFQQLLL